MRSLLKYTIFKTRWVFVMCHCVIASQYSGGIRIQAMFIPTAKSESLCHYRKQYKVHADYAIRTEVLMILQDNTIFIYQPHNRKYAILAYTPALRLTLRIY